MEIFPKLLGDAVVIGMFIAYFGGKMWQSAVRSLQRRRRCRSDAPRTRESGMMTSRFTRTLLAVI